MQCWRLPCSSAFSAGAHSHGPRRLVALRVEAKMKYRANIAQNHSRKSVWVNIDADRLYQQPSYNPGVQVGPLKLQPLPGRGRGLVADRDVVPPETVLLCEPLGDPLTGPQGQDLLPEHLAQALVQLQAAGKLSPADRARVRLLYDGTPDDSPSSVRSRSASLDDFRKLDDKLKRAADAPKKAKGKGFGAPAGADAAAFGSGAAAPGSGIDLVALGEAPLTADEVARLTTYCSWGDSCGDLAATKLRGEALEAIIGVWPEFALLNHSCAPNTVVFTVGKLLQVQAAREVPRGSEVTTSYLADLALAPVAQRNEWLKGSYGFKCACERCTAEASVPSAVSAAVSAAYEAATSEAAVALHRRAIERSDREALRPLEAQLAAAVAQLEAAMEEAQLEAQLRAWLRASAYSAYHTLATIRDLPDPRAGGPSSLFGALSGSGAGSKSAAAPFSDPEVPKQLAAIVGQVAPGSDVHLFLTIDTMIRTGEAYPRTDPRVAEAAKECLRAHILRYGRASDALYGKLIPARASIPNYLGRVTLASAEQQQDKDDAGGSSASPLFGLSGASSLAHVRQAAAQVAAEVAAGDERGQKQQAEAGV